MSKYFDRTLFNNPLYEYLKWLNCKLYYQIKYWGDHLRIGYKSYVKDGVFGKFNYLGRNVSFGYSSLGDYSYISDGCVVHLSVIGKFCSVGPNVRIAPGRHPTSGFVTTHPAFFSKPAFMMQHFVKEESYSGNLPVKIGNDVWIGANCIILDGVEIGDGAVIAANSVVTKNVGAYSVTGGSPARELKKRFSEDEIIQFAALRWWDKSEKWLQENAVHFTDIQQFLKITSKQK